MISRVILIFFLFLSGMQGITGETINTQGPINTEILPSEDAILLCKTGYPYKYCSFTHTSTTETQLYTLDPDVPGYEEGTIVFEGAEDPEKKTCGMKITNVQEKHNGEWRCEISVVVDNKLLQGRGFANITLIKPPTAVTMEVNGIKDGEFKVKYPQDEDQEVKCTATGGRPAPAFRWTLGGKPIEGIKVTEEKDIKPDGTTDFSQTINFKVVQSHNGKSISCTAIQRGYTKEMRDQGLNSVTKVMDVSFLPVAAINDFAFYGMDQGKEGNIMISFLSHPAPQSVEWIMHDQDGRGIVNDSESLDKRYKAKAIREGPTEGYYTAELIINSVDLKDSETKNRLIVQNALGETEYTFTIGIGSPPPSVDAKGAVSAVESQGVADNGAGGSGPLIAAVILLIIIIIIATVITVIAYIRRQLCFHDAQHRDDGEKSAAQFEALEKGEGSPTVESKDDTNPTIKCDPAPTTPDLAEEKRSNGSHTPV